MSDELERLRADLEVIERYSSYAVIENARHDIAEKIKRIENPDPWQKAKAYFDFQRERAKEVDPRHLPMSDESKHVLSYVDHLAAENERLTKRVAELESDPEFTPTILKRADEIAIGDVIPANGMIRTIIEVNPHGKHFQIVCDDSKCWYSCESLIAVLRRPLVESKGDAK